MIVAAFLRRGLGLLVPLGIACTLYLYLYPVFRGCAFPVESRDAEEAFAATKNLHWPYADVETVPGTGKLAPFRLLALGDPQLEGDTSIPVCYLGFLPHLRSIVERLLFQAEHPSLLDRVRMILHDIIDFFFEDIPNIFESIRKRFDLFGNDFYLAHIYRTVHWWTRPTHVSVLGDLLGSQWIEDDEFERRGYRFWNRSFRGAERLPDDLANFPSVERAPVLSGILDDTPEQQVWSRRILNVAGNHDIGYAGDLTPERLARFERVFGKANYELRFRLSKIGDLDVNQTILEPGRRLPEIRIVVLNDMNLDTPARDLGLQSDTYHFINSVINTAAPVGHQGEFTMILTHVPLFKPDGVCVDGPFFDFHSQEEGGGLKEQHLLSSDASKGLLGGIFGVNPDVEAAGRGLGRSGMVLDGHDHEGCDTFHYINQTNGTEVEHRPWQVAKWTDARADGLPTRDKLPGRREITVRSMMGDFGGNAGLLSMWFNESTWEWESEYVECALGRQHFWWFTHFLDLCAVAFALAYGAVLVLDGAGVDVDGRVLDLLDRGRRQTEAYARRSWDKVVDRWKSKKKA